MSESTHAVTVSLVTKPDRARRDFPELMANRSSGRLIQVDYPVRIGPEGIDPKKNKFAAWLATHISTTDFRDDASLVHLLKPYTAGQRLMREMLEDAERLAHHGFGDAIDSLESRIRRFQKTIKTCGNGVFDRLVTAHFTWPVYGSQAIVHIDSPEAYFEHCAQTIRRMGAVPLAAGLAKARPDDSLLRTFAGGMGLMLVNRYDSERVLALTA
jgi:hypothetical protein